MPTEIYMMKLGMTMTEGTVAEWHIPDGGEVKAGEDLYRLETEKVEMEVEAEAAGTVRHLVPAESTVDPGAVVGYIYAAGEEIPAELPVAGASPAAASAPAASADAPAPAAAGRGRFLARGECQHGQHRQSPHQRSRRERANAGTQRIVHSTHRYDLPLLLSYSTFPIR